jgi:alkylation response protein AidB-like acyl-CoA dehydrogenase
MTSEVVERFRELRSLIEQHAAEDPQGEQLAEPVADALLRDSDLMRLWIPESLGGMEARPTEMIAVLEELACADGATGFVALAAVFATALVSASCGDETAERLWGSGEAPIVVGSGFVGRGDATDNGLEVTGRWTFASGIKHATHVVALVDVYNDGDPRLDEDGQPVSLMCVVSRDQVDLIENWDVLGLSRTGSVDFTMDGVHVPWADTFPLPRRDVRPRGGLLFTIGLFGYGTLLHSAWVSGVALRALEELRTAASKRPGRGGEELEKQTARVSAKYYAARALLYGTWSDIEETFARGGTLSSRQELMFRLAINHVSVVAAEVCTFVYERAGGPALKAGRIRDCFQDVYVGNQHVLVGRFLQGCGRALLSDEDVDWDVWAPLRRPPSAPRAQTPQPAS